MRRTNQGGSILGFVAVGGVLVLLLIGGVYVARHNFAPVSGDDGLIARQDEDDTAKDQPAPQPEDKTEPKPSETEPNKEEPSTTEVTPQPVEPEVTEQPTAVEETPAEDRTSQHTASLPTTGPASMVFEGFIISGLVAAVAAYRRSRQITAHL